MANAKAAARTTSPRYEIKITLEPRHLAEFRAWVRLHTAQWRVAYPPRQINNIYFDTATYEGLSGNVTGLADRDKLRLRWYGPDRVHIEEANMEVKRKRGMAGWKEIYPVTCPFDLGATTWPVFCRALREVLPARGRMWLDHFAYPVIINHYRRSYYVTPDGVVRLTVDTDLHAYDQRTSLCPNLIRSSRMQETVIVELKAEREDYVRLSDTLSYFPVAVDRFSKYVQGTTAAPDFTR
jgi:hypothetical protein